MKKNTIAVGITALFLCMGGVLFAQTDDDLFFSDDLFEEEMITEENSAAVETIFPENSVQFGGSISSSLKGDTVWLYSSVTEEMKNIEPTLLVVLNADLFFDARPTENQRLYGKFAVNYIPAGKAPEQKDSFSFSVFELFTDFAFKDTVFFRFGKHTIKWGVGYFFSPSDVLNLTRIDPFDTDKQREGPVSLRSHIVFSGTQTNIWLYVLPDTKTLQALDSAYAAKVEFVAGNTEIGIGAYYTYGGTKEKSPRLVSTVSSTLFGKTAVFAEAVVVFAADSPYFQATLGASYTNQDWKTTFSAQYLYDGFKLTPLHTYHSAALSINCSEFFHKKIGASAVVLSSLTNNSFSAFDILTQLGISYNAFDGLKIHLNPSYTISYMEDKTVQTGALSISAKLGGGKF